MNGNALRRGFDIATSTLATFLRTGVGINAEEAAVLPKRLLELYDIEASPYCRIVREVLTELDLDAVIYPCPKGGTRYRTRAERLGGKTQFPFLVAVLG